MTLWQPRVISLRNMMASPSSESAIPWAVHRFSWRRYANRSCSQRFSFLNPLCFRRHQTMMIAPQALLQAEHASVDPPLLHLMQHLRTSLPNHRWLLSILRLARHMFVMVSNRQHKVKSNSNAFPNTKHAHTKQVVLTAPGEICQEFQRACGCSLVRLHRFSRHLLQ